MRKLPPLSALKAFEAAARHRHFGRAADELFVTHSAISHQVRSLEDALGVALFEKQGRQVALTHVGTRMLHAVEQALDIMAEACADASHPGMRGDLTLSVPPELAHRLFTRIAAEFADRYPDLTLHLLVHDSDSRDVNPSADLTVLYDLPATDWDRYWAVPLRAIDFFPVCHPALVQSDIALLKPTDLAQHRLLHDDQDGKNWATWLGAFAPEIAPPRGNLHFAHSGLAVEAALLKTGVALADELTAGEELKSGRLVRPFSGGVPSPGQYYLVCERRKRDDARLAAFLGFPALAPYLCEINSSIIEN
ncbi:LysR substrate-binding domain-containing protein [Crenobacter cavernae]|uniref:LysR family transcriptional regulator n=1 Tax=Crenobacter cavernae TaxID=2290923 RepID=A0ABY0FGH9_9NEIS|nr:LysR substrate-binding domain-containing protein [Crenobacter cavernae]RXZ45284.1 LysR family transcriptional regulator [Crenobacter cavernae]